MARKSKIKISFDPTNVWNREEFREFLHSLMIDDKVIIPFEFYIVTEETDTVLVNKWAVDANIDSNKIVYCTSQANKLVQLEANGIDIHFDSQQSNIKYIEDNTVTDIKPILVNWMKNHNGLMRYIEIFRRVLNDLNNEN